MLSYNAPKCGNALITFGGLSVTDNGFSDWNYTFPVIGGLPIDPEGDSDGDTAVTRPNVITEIFTLGLGDLEVEASRASGAKQGSYRWCYCHQLLWRGIHLTHTSLSLCFQHIGSWKYHNRGNKIISQVLFRD
jgi:hypothetical protein